LLDAGADANQRAGNDLTALMWAAGHSNDVPAPDALVTLNLLLERGAALDAADNRGRTALMTAATQGHAGIVARLLAAGADAALRDRQGKTARDLAADEQTRDALPAT
jgi:ankyrin repeat protein